MCHLFMKLSDKFDPNHMSSKKTLLRIQIGVGPLTWGPCGGALRHDLKTWVRVTPAGCKHQPQG